MSRLGDSRPADPEAIGGLYRRHAAAFDRLRSRALFERTWLERFLAGLPSAPAVLDLGCGMGEPLARYLIGRDCRVTGVDAALPMIALCRARFPDQEWVVADMRGLDLGRRFDGILAWDSFFHLDAEAQRRMFPVFRRHAAEGAALLFTSGTRQGEAFGSFQGEPLYHASLDGAEYRALLAAEGFEVAAQTDEDPDCGGHTVWLARRTR